MMNEIGARYYKETRSSLRKNKKYKKLISNLEIQINKGGLVWFGTKELMEPPLTMLAAHYVKGKMDTSESSMDSDASLPNKDFLKREISHFIYELEDEIANIEEEFTSVYEMSKWLDRFDKGNVVALNFRRNGIITEYNDDKLRDIMSIRIKVGNYSTEFWQSRTGFIIHDSVTIRGPAEDLLYRNEWERKIGMLDGLCRMMSIWQVSSRFSWAIEAETANNINTSWMTQKKHVND